MGLVVATVLSVVLYLVVLLTTGDVAVPLWLAGIVVVWCITGIAYDVAHPARESLYR